MDPGNSAAILGIVSMLRQQKKFSEAIAKLQLCLPYHETDWMHTHLADLYLLTKDTQHALEHYNAALNLNSDFDRAKEGIQRIERLLQGNRSHRLSLGDTIGLMTDEEMQDVDETDNELDEEEDDQ